MIVDVVMPKMGESITEGTILEWRKQAGETIEQDETLLEIGTDKVDSEIPSSATGTVVEILAEVNDVIEVGVVIARIDTEGKTPAKSESKTNINLGLELTINWYLSNKDWWFNIQKSKYKGQRLGQI